VICNGSQEARKERSTSQHIMLPMLMTSLYLISLLQRRVYFIIFQILIDLFLAGYHKQYFKSYSTSPRIIISGM
jgi:hypothetical protein